MQIETKDKAFNEFCAGNASLCRDGIEPCPNIRAYHDRKLERSAAPATVALFGSGYGGHARLPTIRVHTLADLR